MYRFAVVVLMAVLLVACGGTATTSSPQASQKPKSGGTLQVALESELRTLDPVFSTQLVEREVFYNMYEPLVEIDQRLKIIPGLATSWDIPDPTTYVFHLRQGVHFQDGTAFDAAAVKWNLDRDRTAPGSFRKNDLSSVDTVEVRNASTVVLHLKQPDATLLSTLVDRAGMILSPTAVQKGGKDFARNPLGAGTGPFEFVEWQNGDHLTLKKNPDYWQKGKPYLNQIIFHPITNTDSSLAQLRSGGLDVVRVVSGKDVAGIKQDSSLVYKAIPGLAFDGIEINRKGAFANPDRARAVALAIDRPQIVQNVDFGVGTVSHGPIPPPSWAYDPSEKLYEGAQAAKAKQTATGFTFTLKATNTPDSLQAAQLIKAQLAKAGITMEIQSEEFGQLLNEVEAHTFDAALVGWSGRIDPDGNMYAWFHTGGVNNDDQYSNAKVDSDLEQARLTTNQAQRKRLYDDAQKQLVGDVAYVFIHHAASQEVHTTHVHGFTIYPDQMLRFVDTWKS